MFEFDDEVDGFGYLTNDSINSLDKIMRTPLNRAWETWRTSGKTFKPACLDPTVDKPRRFTTSSTTTTMTPPTTSGCVVSTGSAIASKLATVSGGYASHPIPTVRSSPSFGSSVHWLEGEAYLNQLLINCLEEKVERRQINLTSVQVEADILVKANKTLLTLQPSWDLHLKCITKTPAQQEETRQELAFLRQQLLLFRQARMPLEGPIPEAVEPVTVTSEDLRKALKDSKEKTLLRSPETAPTVPENSQ